MELGLISMGTGHRCGVIGFGGFLGIWEEGFVI